MDSCSVVDSFKLLSRKQHNVCVNTWTLRYMIISSWISCRWVFRVQIHYQNSSLFPMSLFRWCSLCLHVVLIYTVKDDFIVLELLCRGIGWPCVWPIFSGHLVTHRRFDQDQKISIMHLNQLLKACPIDLGLNLQSSFWTTTAVSPMLYHWLTTILALRDLKNLGLYLNGSHVKLKRLKGSKLYQHVGYNLLCFFKT